jgi:flavin reductase (DIM6/NTAB) family NADH-FMN oxidoreductase RutF
MAKTFLTESQITGSTSKSEYLPNLARTLTAPMPQVLFVVQDPELGDGGVYVRTVTMGPLSWRPYTKSVAIPRDDEKLVRCLQPGTPCVLGLPSRKLLRQLAICRQRLPRGIGEGTVARLQLYKAEYGPVPIVHECPVNFEGVMEHIEPYHTHLVAFVRVVGASIDESYVALDRAEIIQTYPTNFADEVFDEDRGLRMRLSVLKDIYPCPEFPVGQKLGWGSSFDQWMKELADEKYLSKKEQVQIAGWYRRWREIYGNVESAERKELKEKLTTVCHLVSTEQWKKVHAVLAAG